MDYEAISEKVLGFKLNSEQIDAVKEIVKWAKEYLNYDPFKILGGYAGTGKSTIIKMISHSLPDTRIALCAPTNKAVKVLDALGTNCDCMTIYSLLGLKMEQHEDKLKLEKAMRDRVNRYSMIIIDESSMINTELMNIIVEVARRNGVKVLFVGDPGQLNPVGEALSPIWGKFPMIVIRKIERHDNQILDFVTNVRSMRLNELKFDSNNANDEGVWVLNRRDFITEVKEYAVANKFSERISRVVAWRNKTVDAFNKIIRKSIYGDMADHGDWLEGDRITFTEPLRDGEEQVAITDDEACIKTVSIGEHPVYGHKCYYLDVMMNDEVPATIPVIHGDAFYDLVDEMSVLAAKARRAKQDRDYRGSKALWEQYWEMNDAFAKIKHGYALTAHRAQGSTYENVFVDADDILTNTNVKEAKRCLYVASSRPSTRLKLTV